MQVIIIYNFKFTAIILGHTTVRVGNSVCIGTSHLYYIGGKSLVFKILIALVRRTHLTCAHEVFLSQNLDVICVLEKWLVVQKGFEMYNPRLVTHTGK